jgi:hypothetical protein
VKRACVLLGVLALAGCGGSKRIAADHVTLTDVHVREHAVVFTFDSVPQEIEHAYVARAALAECGSGAPVRPTGTAFLVVHFKPAQSQGVPKRIVMPSGVVLDVWKVCDFEADVGWAIGVSQHLPVHVSTGDRTVTVNFG